VGSWVNVILYDLPPFLWLAWVIYWIISARSVKQTVRRETWQQRLPYSLPFAFGIALFWFPHHFPFLLHRVIGDTFTISPTETGVRIEEIYTAYWIGTGLLVAGLLFSVWARVILGTNWSGTVTVKENHELIQTGPYRWVRHPIYTGLLLALIGSALAQDLWSSVLALALMFVSFWIKLLREERWMRETFGAQYEQYCAHTARLVPFVL